MPEKRMNLVGLDSEEHRNLSISVKKQNNDFDNLNEVKQKVEECTVEMYMIQKLKKSIKNIHTSDNDWEAIKRLVNKEPILTPILRVNKITGFHLNNADTYSLANYRITTKRYPPTVA